MILWLGLTAVLPTAIAAGLLIMENRGIGPAKDPGRASWQIICGCAFGALAIFATETGIEANGAVINVRDAAPLCAALMFGAPAGIIAGIIGGAERALAALWGIGVYTQVACSFATVLAGVFGALLRRYVFERQVPPWYVGLLSGFFVEVVDMLLIILTHMSDVAQAFFYVQVCALPMICLNGVAVMIACAIVPAVRGTSHARGVDGRALSQTFQGWLACVTLAAFLMTTGFAALLQTRLTRESVSSLLSYNLRSVENQAGENMTASTLLIAAACRTAVADVPDENLHRVLDRLAWQYDIAEINLISPAGIITASTFDGYVGYDMYSGVQSAKFMEDMSSHSAVIEDIEATSYNPEVTRGYVGMRLETSGYIQLGFAEKQLSKQWAEQMRSAVRDWPVGEHGFVIIAEQDGQVVSDGGRGAATLADAGLIIPEDEPEDELFRSDVFGDASYCMYSSFNDYILVATLPLSEAHLERDMSVYLTVFTQIVIFVILFLVVACLIRYLVVSNVQRVNQELDRITAGDLDTFVDVRPNQEFASLSDGINSTVMTLKRYIAEAETRMDEELELARAIQMSALPRAFPENDAFRLHAAMRTAKEVGGDFYDFFMLGSHHVAIVAADVSGKGIPAALFMMSAKSTIKSLAERGLSPAEVFTLANDELCEHNEAQMFVTAWMGIVDLQTGRMQYVNAGHNAPLIGPSGGTFEYLPKRGRGLVLAAMSGVRYRQNNLQLEPGSRIFLYTDGITEAIDEDGDMFGEKRLEEVLNATRHEDVEDMCADVIRSVDEFAGSEPQADDITVLAFQLARSSDTKTVSVDVRPDLADLAQLMDAADGAMHHAKVPDRTMMETGIAIDEIFSNIVRHSGASHVHFEISVGNGEIRVEFRDDGKPHDPTQAGAPDVTARLEDRVPGGLGIFMLRRIMTSMAYRHESGQNILTVTKQFES